MAGRSPPTNPAGAKPWPLQKTPNEDPHNMRPDAPKQKPAKAPPPNPAELRALFFKRHPHHPAHFYATQAPSEDRLNAVIAASSGPDGPKAGYRQRVRVAKLMLAQLTLSPARV